MRLTFCGAARTTTGSMHRLEINGRQILLDCGLYQGRRKEAFERNRNMPIDPTKVEIVLLSHAHIDHSGNLPTLVRKGFRGPIIATPATRDLCDIMLRDSAYLQERDVAYVNRKRIRQGKNPFEPLYTTADIDPTMDRFETLDYETPLEIIPGVTVTFHDAGHILGSGLTAIDVEEDGRRRRLVFTGDLGRKDMPILKDPVVVGDIDILLTESTYGNRLHHARQDVCDELADTVNSVVRTKGKLIIPAFSVGRTQQIVYFLRELHEKKEIPHLPVFVDSPLSSRATDVYEGHPECYDSETMQVLLDNDAPFSFRGLKYITDVKDSKKLNRMPGPAIIISASGMCEGGRILHHLKNNVEDERNGILIVGYQAEHTLGRRLVEGVPTIKIFGEHYSLRARVQVINALSAHADKNEMLDYFGQIGKMPERVFIVHGEMDQAEPFSESLRQLGMADVTIPERGQVVEI